MVQLSGILLAGGEGRRLGAYKPTIPVAGEPLLLRPFRVLQALTEDVVIAYGAEAHQPAIAELELGARLVGDEGLGPLQGLLRALRLAGGEWVLLAPCDAPLLSGALYEALLERGEGREAAVPRLRGVPNPVVGAYRREPLELAGHQVAARGEGALMEVLPLLDVAYLEGEALEALPHGEDALLDVDTPALLERAEALLAP